MISRTTLVAALFAMLVTASLAGAAELHVRKVDAAAAAPVVAVVQLPTVVVTGKRIAAQA